ncbi:unnamed protein product [Didymodactylos carnosus]|uniref:Nuclease HARBI1 n=1 Tax=Didymodactylos carnosus TaxID=1234261 RepID=A0A814JUW7_9BILA|nr:unnamed protein product [Didymodactylos carnosus]CAF3810925.1 unnamed protein product [Didymodactylos carnosus]
MAIATILAARAFERERVFRGRQNPLGTMTDDMVLARYRFPKTAIINLLTLIEPQIVRATQRTQPIPPVIQLLTALRFYATGLFVDGDIHGISKASVSRLMKAISAILANMATQTITFPSTANELDEIKQGFYETSRFQRVIGVIDCTYVQIKTSSQNEGKKEF